MFKKIALTFLLLSFIVIPASYSKDLQKAVRDDGLISNIKKAIEVKNSNFPYSVGDPIPLIDTTSADVTMTLPAITAWDDEPYRHEIELVHSAGGHNVIVKLNGTETFAWGNTYFNLGSALKGFTLAAIHNGAMQKYGILRNVTINAAARRNASWSASSFNSMTIIPMDGEMYNNQSELLTYTAGTGFRYTVLATGDYYINYKIVIDSTGGGTWNATSEVFKNGVTLGKDYQMRGGNYGNEDDSMTFPRTKLTLAAGQYIDLRIDQNNLTGNLILATLSIEIRL